MLGLLRSIASRLNPSLCSLLHLLGPEDQPPFQVASDILSEKLDIYLDEIWYSLYMECRVHVFMRMKYGGRKLLAVMSL